MNFSLWYQLAHRLFIIAISQMASILRKAAKYRSVSSILVEGEAHLKDPFIPAPKILKPPVARTNLLPDDITDFPQYKTVPLPESIPYMEGKYRPPSIPFVAGKTTTHIHRLVPIQCVSAGRKGLYLVLVRPESDQSQLRRFVQRCSNSLPSRNLQCVRERLLQAVQLQKLS
jgi:hypothetical protein